jgi:hypothetical protein
LSPARQQTVPALLSASAQENLKRAQLQSQQIHSRKAPQSPGEDASDADEKSSSSSCSLYRDVERAVSRQSAARQLPANPRRGLRRQSFARNHFSTRFSFHRSSATLDLSNSIDRMGISNFNEELSESSAPEDGEDLLHFPAIQSIQLDPRNIMICCAAFGVIAVIALGAWLSPAPVDDDLMMNEGDGTTLGIVRARGHVKCAMSNMVIGASNSDNNQTSWDTLHRFNIEQCRAMALIALGDATKYEPVLVDMDARFELLANRTVDIITEGTAFTM